MWNRDHPSLIGRYNKTKANHQRSPICSTRTHSSCTGSPKAPNHQPLSSLRAPHCLLTYESGLASAGRQSAEHSLKKKKKNTANFLPLTAHGCPSVRIMSYYLQKVSHQFKYYSICCFFSVAHLFPSSQALNVRNHRRFHGNQVLSFTK